MKTRNVLLALAAAAAMPAFAFNGNNVCGLVRIESGSANTVIGVPWVEVGTGGNVTVAKLVSTANLTVGDELRYYDAGTDTWFGWKLDSSEWKPQATAKDGVTITAPEGDALKIARGKALVLVRKNPTTNGTPNPFYLYGQYASATVAAQTITRDASKQVYTLLASPYAAAFDLNADGESQGTKKIQGMNGNDQIIVFDPNTGAQSFFLYRTPTGGNASAWCREVVVEKQLGNKTFKQSTWRADAVVVPPGMGFWYVAAAGEGTVTIAW